MIEKSELSEGQRDLLYIAGLVAVTYILFFLLGAIGGLRLNEIVGELQSITFFAAAFAVITLALNLHWGYTGMFNIGVAGFMAIGVYVMAIATAPVDGDPAGLGLPIYIGVIAGMLAAGLAGALLAIPTLNVRADYFAIITLGFAEIVRLSIESDTLRSFEVGGTTYGTGGSSGISYAAPNSVVDWIYNIELNLLITEIPLGSQIQDTLYSAVELIGISTTMIDRLIYAFIVLLFALLIYLILRRIAYSPLGRVLKAIREDEIVAKSLGKDTSRTKVKIFALGSALMGLGGILWIGRGSFISPDSFMPIVTFYLFVALVIGGSGSNTGSVVGAFVFAAFLWQGPRYLRTIVQTNVDTDAPATIYGAILELGSADIIPLLSYFAESLNELRWIVLGLVLILLMIYRPEGIFGDRKEIAAATDLSQRQRGDD